MPRYPIRFSFTPGQSERIEAVVTAPKPHCSIVHGTVYDLDGNRVENAIVRLFALGADDGCDPVSDALTDADGEFVFGPLEAERNYLIKVYINGLTLREVTIRPKRKRVKA